MLGEDPGHLIYGLDVELLARELHPVGVVVELAGPDAEQHVVHPGVVPRSVVRIVGRDERNAGLFVEPEETIVDAPLLFDAVVLHLQINVVEDPSVFDQEPSRLIETSLQYPGRDLSREAAGETDDPTPILPQHLHVDTRLVVEALQKPAGGELHEVPVALCGPGDEREVVVRSAAPVITLGRDVDLAAHQGLYPSVFGLLVELDRAVHYTVVRERKPWHPLVLRKGDEVPYAARPVEHRILRMTVQVRKSAARHNRQPSSLCFRVSATPQERAPPVA